MTQFILCIRNYFKTEVKHNSYWQIPQLFHISTKHWVLWTRFYLTNSFCNYCVWEGANSNSGDLGVPLVHLPSACHMAAKRRIFIEWGFLLASFSIYAQILQSSWFRSDELGRPYILAQDFGHIARRYSCVHFEVWQGTVLYCQK